MNRQFKVGAHALSAGLLILALVWCRALLAGPAGISPAAGGASHVFRMAFTTNMFDGVNEGDARAAMKVWIMAVSKEQGIPVDPDPVFFRNLDELVRVSETNPVDGVGMVASEYMRLSRRLKFDRLGVASYDQRITEAYVVLVRSDSRIDRLEQLRGRTLNVLDTPRSSLAMTWLDTVLLEARLKQGRNFFRQINGSQKASLVILPVFFHQADVCLTTSNSFRVMAELNPQLGRQLRVLAMSPEFLPTFFAFCAVGPGSLRPELFEAMKRMHETPTGRQILTLVKADRVVEEPLSILEPTLELLARHDRLCADAGPETSSNGNASSLQ